MNPVSEIWSILRPAQRRQLLAAQAISLVMALSTVTGIAAIAPFFAVLGNPQLIERQPWLYWLYLHGHFSSWHGFVEALGVVFIAVVVGANCINAIGSTAMSRLALRIGYSLQTELFREYLSRPYLFYTTTNSATLFNNVIYEAARFNNGILQNALLLVSNLATAAFILVSILVLNPVVGAATLLGLVAGYGLMYWSVRTRLIQLSKAQAGAWVRRCRIVNESLGAVRELLLLGNRRPFQESFERATEDVLQSTAHIRAVGQLPKYIMECTAVFVLVGIALLLNARGQTAGAWLGELTFMGFAAYRLLPILQQVFASAVNIRSDRSSFALIASDLRRARVAKTDDGALKRTHTRSEWWQRRPHGQIRLQEVSFQYAPDGPRVLDRINLCIPARSVVGLVGANGSGKTTMMDLIAGLLLPTAGEVQVDGLALSAANCADWHSQIAYVSQHPFLLDGSIARNIAFGIPERAIDWDRVARAARLAQLEALIESLPGGYDHRVGERGIQLSGGERQKIAIARAMYRHASVLLLDEATSALDGLTEIELVPTLRGLRGEYTIVLISHRLSTMRCCDAIFQLENGRITGSGDYQGLRSNSEWFARTVGT